MGSRWMQQKVIKQKRMRRAWAKPYSMKNTGPSKFPMAITRIYMDGQAKRSVTDVGIKGRSIAAKSLIKPYLLTRFRYDPNSNEAIYVRTRGLHSDLDPSSKELILARVNARRSPVNGGQNAGETQYVYHICVDRKTCHRRLYIGGDICFFIEARITKKGPVLLKSVEYKDRREALKAHRNTEEDKDGGILWDEVNSPPFADTV